MSGPREVPRTDALEPSPGVRYRDHVELGSA
jgi:hypothetical protein